MTYCVDTEHRYLIFHLVFYIQESLTLYKCTYCMDGVLSMDLTVR